MIPHRPERFWSLRVTCKKNLQHRAQPVHPVKDIQLNAKLRQKCIEHNLRVTRQRLGILSCLQGSKQHPSADAVFRKIRKTYPNISFDTVNRTLLSFARMGILDVVEGYGNPKRYDPDRTPHHHFHCLRCHRIVDFEERSYEKLRPPQSILRRHKVTGQKVILVGVCDRCLKQRECGQRPMEEKQ
jgi:Fur family peroxide stress response transcriptional regulator